MELQPIGRVDVHSVHPDRRPPIYDITTARAEAPGPDSICITCVNRTHRHVTCEGGVRRPCDPGEWNVALRLQVDGCLTRTDEPHHHGGGAGLALVHSCGQQLRSECTRCAHFVPLTHGQRMVADYEDGWRKLYKVGGWCSLPPEGVLNNAGVRVHCLPEPQMFTILDEPSCATCANVAKAGPKGEFLGVTDLFGTVVRTGLDPYERSLARIAYHTTAPEDEPTPVWKANVITTNAQASAEVGFVSTYLAEVVESDEHTATRTLADGTVVEDWFVTSVVLRLNPNSSKTVRLECAGNEAVRFTTKQSQRQVNNVLYPAKTVSGLVPPGQIVLERSRHPHKMVVHLQLWPWRALFGLPPRQIERYVDPVVPWPCGHAKPKRFADRRQAGCPRCEPNAACDFHARAPQWQRVWDPVLKKETLVVVFADPGARDPRPLQPPPEAAVTFTGGSFFGPDNLGALRHQMYRLHAEAERLADLGHPQARAELMGLWLRALDSRLPRTETLDAQLEAADIMGRPPTWRRNDPRSERSIFLMRQVRANWEADRAAGVHSGVDQHLRQKVNRLPLASYDTRDHPYPQAQGGIVHVRDDAQKFDKEIFWEDGPWMVYHRPYLTSVWPSGTLEPGKYYCFSFLHGDAGLDLPKVMGIRNFGESFWGPTTQLADRDPRAKPGSYHTGEFHRYDVEDYLRANDFGARIQESIDAALYEGGLWNPFTSTFTKGSWYGPPVPEEMMRVTRYDAFGLPIDFADNWPGGYDRAADQAEYTDWLDEAHEIYVTNSEPEKVSNRWRFFGPDAMLTGPARPEHREVSVDSVWGEDPATHWEYADDDEDYEDHLDEREFWDDAEGDDYDDRGLDIADPMHEAYELPWQRYEIICLDCARTAHSPEEAVVDFTIDEAVKPTQEACCPRCGKHNTVVVELIGEAGTRGGERGYCPRCKTMYRGITAANDICLAPDCVRFAKAAHRKHPDHEPYLRLVMVDEGKRYEALEHHRKIRVFRSSDDKIQRAQMERHGSDCPSYVRAENGSRRFDDKAVPVTLTAIENRRQRNAERRAKRRARRQGGDRSTNE